MWNFMLKYSWKKKTWKVFFGHQSLGDQTSILVSQMAWIYGGGGGVTFLGVGGMGSLQFLHRK